MAVSIADMERVALGGSGSRFGEDIGNVIELGDLGAGDDLGLSMLMNPSKVSVKHSYDNSRTVNVNSFSPPISNQGGSGSGGISFSGPLEPLEALEPIIMDAQPIDMNSFGGGPVEINVVKDVANAASTANANASKGIFGGLFGNSQSATGPGVQLASPARDPEAEKKDKSEYLNKLQRLEAKGFPVSRKFTMDNSLDEIKAEYFRLVDARQLETSLKFQRQMLMGAITGMEWLNGRFDPFDMKLDGWSESVHENVEDFDEIFEELYDKYKDRGKMSPEMRLVMAVGGSGFMCHVSNSFFRNKMPNMDDVLRNNPELARQMASAAAQQAGPGFGNFMGMAMGVPQQQQQQQQQGYSGNGGPMQMPGGPLSGPNPLGPNPSPVANTGAFFAASAATPMRNAPPEEMMQQQQQRQTVRREMAGPSGVDDILRTFDEVRRSESMAASVPHMATGYATQPAVAAALSVVSADELVSQADTARTGPGGRRGGRRRTQAPVGNTIALNV